MAALSDGSYALAGYQERPYPGASYVQPDVWVLRITASGDTLRSRYYGGATDFETLRDLRPTPHGGLLLTTVKSIGAGPNVYTKAWLMQLDSLGQVQWQHLLGPATGASAPSYDLSHGRPLADGSVLVSGYRNTGQYYTQQLTQYLALFRPAVGGVAQPVWERYTPSSGPDYEPNRFLDLSPNGTLTLAGTFSDATQNNTFELTRLSSVGLPYEPNLCQTPPVAAFGYAPTPTGDSLRFVSLSTPGPPYAQFVRWRWDFGDGTHSDGPAPPPHHYAPGSGAATGVRLTVTNNLGCTSTAVVYPFALATAAQRLLQDRLSAFPNPAGTGGATVQLPGLRAQGPVAGELLNPLGQVVRRVSWPASQLAQSVRIDLNGLATGVYTLRLRPQEGALVKRLVIQ
ncbi:PKD domain-containing protein [Hymenobacter terricola]|uniref:PKD domain-containing protein n=1 Tax=Hymenobacter terricola TaxID=2819236 RepID=UPI001B3110DC|nr:PKD domain-containing protein [Hymenobacter terricola]